MSLSLQEVITQLRGVPVFGKYLVRGFQDLEEAVNHISKDIGVNPTGTLPQPPPVKALSVKTSTDGFMHIAINDNSPISRNLRYFVEYATDPSFQGAHVLDLGASRTHPPFKLPAKDDGGNPQSFVFRAFSQYPDSSPGKKVNFGGTTPTPVTPGGTTQMTLLPSTGSGTDSSLLPRGGEGLGSFLVRSASGPKRTSQA